MSEIRTLVGYPAAYLIAALVLLLGAVAAWYFTRSGDDDRGRTAARTAKSTPNASKQFRDDVAALHRRYQAGECDVRTVNLTAARLARAYVS
ncbi:MAG: hypothetical protein Q4Q03_02105, partial [Bowdeniella nasicola]|nr:hypothetical protein [Bowdeniella nasicola]